MTAARPPRYRVTVYELRDGKTTQVIDVYGTGFITAVATHFDGEDLPLERVDGFPPRRLIGLGAPIRRTSPEVRAGRAQRRRVKRRLTRRRLTLTVG